MERKREEWIEALREAALSESGQKLPEGLWDRIAASLDDAPVPRPAALRRRIYVWASSVAAAAAVAALGIFALRTSVDNLDAVTGLSYEVSHNPATPLTPPPAPEPSDAEAEEGWMLSGKTIADNTAPHVRKTSHTTAKAALTPGTAGSNPDAQAAAGITDGQEGSDAPAQHSRQTAQTPEKRDHPSAGNSAAGSLPPIAAELPVRRKTARPAIRTSLSATGVASVSNSAAPAFSGRGAYADAAVLSPNTEGLMVMRAPLEQYSYRHRQPLTFALNVDVNVGHNLFVGAGVSYSMLSSTVTSLLDHREFSQRVQYVGIPVTLRWAFLNTRFLTLYAGLEGQAEFCVDARFGGEKADNATVQWSAHALAGAQFNISKHIGIYAEPKLSHYFRETGLATIRNTQGVNFNLQLGLRFSY